MGRLIKNILIVVILLAVIFPLRPYLEPRVKTMFEGAIRESINIADWVKIKLGLAPAPCEEPIPYILGTFDSKFNISQEYFLSAILDAEKIWEGPTGENLFEYTPKTVAKNAVTMNLIYDYRQDASNELQSINTLVKKDQSTYDALRKEYEDLNTAYLKNKKTFEANVADFESRNDTYNEEVTYWNTHGNPPPGKRKELETRRVSLVADAKKLDNDQNALNQLVRQTNSLAATLNQLASDLNIKVDAYNEIGGALGESFEEGVYHEDNYGREITIYEFSDRAKLVRVLAHELGHAIGLQHVIDPKAIMYEFNSSDNGEATAVDLDALAVICNFAR